MLCLCGNSKRRALGLWSHYPPPSNPQPIPLVPSSHHISPTSCRGPAPDFCVRRNPAKMKSTNVRKGSAAKDLAQQHVETEGCVGLQLLTSAWLSLPPLSTNAQHARARIPRGASVTRIFLLSAPLLSDSPTPLGLTAPNVFIPTAISAPEINRKRCQFSRQQCFSPVLSATLFFAFGMQKIMEFKRETYRLFVCLFVCLVNQVIHQMLRDVPVLLMR